MDLNIFKKKDQENSSEYYWSLVIGESWIQAGIWTVVQEKVHLLSQGNVTSWEEGNQESLVSAADGTLSSAASSAPDNIEEPNKVVFGLPASWVQDGGDIAKGRLDVLKKLTDELELSPSGFVVIPEAIVHFLKSKEGAPLNGILLGISEDIVEVTLVQNGKLVGSQEVSRSVSLGADLAEGLSKIPTISQYPTRLLLYDHKAGNLEDARQNLLQTDWEEKVNIRFLHTPKVEVLDESTALIAASLAGGAEVGGAKLIVVEEEEVKEDEGGISTSYQENNENQLDEEQESNSETAHLLEDIGFLEDEDISQQDKSQKEIEEEPLEDFDFSEHDNIRIPEKSFVSPDPIPQAPKIKKGLNLGNSLKGLSLPKISLSGGGMIGISVFAVILLLLVAGIAYWYLPKATVSIFVAPKKVDKSLQFTVDPGTSVVNEANSILPASYQEVDVSGDKTANTTGTKTVGDRAKGTVTITNGGGSKVLKSGTVLSGPNSLKFTLDQDITVASASSVAKPSQTQASVTAGDIGAQYNLAAGSEFSVGNFSKLDMVAQNDDAISGGSSREIAAVSDKDQSQLLQDLSQELTQKGIDQLNQTISSDQILIQDSAAFSPANKTYSNKVGEEASTVKLSLAGKIKVLILPKDALQSYAMSNLSSDVPQGFTLKPEQLTFNFQVTKPKPADTSSTSSKKDNKTTSQDQTPIASNPQITTQVQANLLPQVNPDEIKKNIAGKKPADAKAYLVTIPGFSRFEIEYKVKLPPPLDALPVLTKNITIDIEAD